MSPKLFTSFKVNVSSNSSLSFKRNVSSYSNVAFEITSGFTFNSDLKGRSAYKNTHAFYNKWAYIILSNTLNFFFFKGTNCTAKPPSSSLIHHTVSINVKVFPWYPLKAQKLQISCCLWDGRTWKHCWGTDRGPVFLSQHRTVQYTELNFMPKYNKHWGEDMARKRHTFKQVDSKTNVAALIFSYVLGKKKIPPCILLLSTKFCEGNCYSSSPLQNNKIY